MAYEIDATTKKMRDDFLQTRKNEAGQRASTSLQQGEDALQRRFTAMGSANSGAHVAALQKNRDAASEVARQGAADVNSQALQFAESDSGRGFQSDEAKIQRDFQGGLADKDFAFKERLSGIEQGNKLKEIDLAERQFALDKDTTEFNKRMAEIEAGREAPKGPLDGITKGIGSIGSIGGLTDGLGSTGKFIANPIASITSGGK